MNPIDPGPALDRIDRAVAPSTTIGMRSHQALKKAMVACIRPTLECTQAAMALPVTLA